MGTPPSGAEQPTEPQLQQTPATDGGRNSLTINLEEVHTDTGDGASSATVLGNPVFYAGVMVRGHKTDLVRLFELPPNERLLGDFHCAMRKRVLLQGRMYIFDHYVCFYSAVFGFAKKRRIPMRTIKAVRKRKHLGFPNSLEIETDDTKEFFTSFLSREEAYQLIVKQINESKSTENGALSAAVSVRDLSSPPASNRGGAEGTRRGVSISRAGAMPRGSSGLNGDRSLLTRNSGSMGDDDGDDEEDSSSVYVMEPHPAPDVPSGARHVLHSTLPGTPREFFDVVLADSAPFIEDFLDSQGNRRIHMTSWKRHPQLGHVRDMNFTAPIKGAFGNWGVSHTACYQSQRFCLYSDEHIVFESSQTMTDIPYGDCFTVDQRWDIQRDPDADPERPSIIYDLYVRVPFSNRCLFKSVIESGSVKQVQDTFAQFVEQLRPVMQERLLSRNTLNMSELPDPQLSATPRMNSVVVGGNRNAPVARSMQHVPSMRGLTTPKGRPAQLQGGGLDGGEAGEAPSGRRSSGEPSVGRLLLSLGGRLAEGARGVLESGIDVVLNLTQCRTTPQMRFLVALVIIMFAANAVCMVGYMWHSWNGGGGDAAAASHPSLVTVGTQADGGAGVLLPDGAAAAGIATLWGNATGPSGAAAATSGGGGGDGGAAGSMAYWLQRMAVLQQEMQMLQGRMDLLSKEVGAVMTHLTHLAAGAGAGDAAGAPRSGGGPAGGTL